MHGPLTAVGVVDVERIDPHQHGTSAHEPLGQLAGEMWMAAVILLGAPVSVPARLHQHGAAAHLALAQGQAVDRSLASLRADDDTVEVRERGERKLGEIFTVGVTVEGAVHVRTGVRHHLDLADVELRTRGIALARCLTTEVVTYDWRGQSLVRHHPVLDGVTHVDEAGRRHASPRRSWS